MQSFIFIKNSKTPTFEQEPALSRVSRLDEETVSLSEALGDSWEPKGQKQAHHCQVSHLVQRPP